MTILPTIYGVCNKVVCVAQTLLQSKVNRYRLFVVLDMLLIVLFITHGPYKPNTRVISAFSSLPIAYAVGQHNTFSFVPGWTTTKLEKVNIDGVAYLAYFDVPLNTDGTLNRDSYGYARFKSEDAMHLFEKAKNNETKVLLAVTMTNSDDIQTFLSNTNAQDLAINEIALELKNAGIDGVNIIFKPKWSNETKNAFNIFIKNLTNSLHKQIIGSTVSVSIPSNTISKPLYDIHFLADTADKIFLVAYSYPVTEIKNAKASEPVYGYAKNQYWSTVSKSLDTLSQNIPTDKIVLETAWYGNGENYPDIVPASANTTESQNTISTPLSTETIEGLISEVPDQAKDAARKNLPFIAKALEKEGILTPNVLAYALATIQHETAETFEPIDEYYGRENALRFGYEGGADYFGRGFIQLTHLRNYKQMGQRIGVGDALVKNPDLACKPDIAAEVLAAYFKDNGIAQLAMQGDFTDARQPINPDYNGYAIAQIAWRYRNMIV